MRGARLRTALGCWRNSRRKCCKAFTVGLLRKRILCNAGMAVNLSVKAYTASAVKRTHCRLLRQIGRFPFGAAGLILLSRPIYIEPNGMGSFWCISVQVLRPSFIVVSSKWVSLDEVILWTKFVHALFTFQTRPWCRRLKFLSRRWKKPTKVSGS